MDNQLGEGKSFWEKPQGTPGMIGIALLICGAGYMVLKNAAWLALAMSNLTTAVFMGLGLFSLVWLLSDKKVRMLIWYFYKSMIEKVTGVFIEIDPIGIIKVYIQELKDKRTSMSDQLTKLKGEKGKIDRKSASVIEEMKSFLNKGTLAKNKMNDAKTASEKNKFKAQASLNASKAGRRKNTAKKLTDLSERMGNLYKVMNDMYYYSGIMIDNTTDQVETLEYERNSIHASYSVMKSAQAIINGNSDEADMFDRAMQSVADDIGSKLGEMDRFMDMSENFMDGVDLENGAFEMDGFELMAEWENGDAMKFLNEGTIDYVGLVKGESPEPIKVDRNYQGNKEIKNKTDFFS